MKIEPSTQRADGPPGKPPIQDPVLVTMERPVYCVSERGPVISTHPIYCGRAFAETVLAAMHDLLEAAGWSIAHVGVYNPRQARRANGALIKPVRWSNHAYGEAMDFKGVVDSGGRLRGLDTMRSRHAELLEALQEECGRRILAARRRPEIVDEGGWLHIGLWPEKRS